MVECKSKIPFRFEKKQHLQYVASKSFRKELNLRSRLPESGMIKRKTTISFGLTTVWKRITPALIKKVFRLAHTTGTVRQLCALTVLLCAIVLSTPFFVSADTAAVKSVKHSAAVTPHKHVKDQTVHVVADPFDGSNGQLALPTVRPDFVSIWDGRIVDVAGPTTRPGFLIYGLNQQKNWLVWFGSRPDRMYCQKRS